MKETKITIRFKPKKFKDKIRGMFEGLKRGTLLLDSSYTFNTVNADFAIAPSDEALFNAVMMNVEAGRTVRLSNKDGKIFMRQLKKFDKKNSSEVG